MSCRDLILVLGDQLDRGDQEQARLWKATRAGGVAIPFAFGLHFAGTTQLAENPWPLGALLLILSAGSCWLARRETRDVAVAAVAAPRVEEVEEAPAEEEAHA